MRDSEKPLKRRKERLRQLKKKRNEKEK